MDEGCFSAMGVIVHSMPIGRIPGPHKNVPQGNKSITLNHYAMHFNDEVQSYYQDLLISIFKRFLTSIYKGKAKVVSTVTDLIMSVIFFDYSSKISPHLSLLESRFMENAGNQFYYERDHEYLHRKLPGFWCYKTFQGG